MSGSAPVNWFAVRNTDHLIDLTVVHAAFEQGASCRERAVRRQLSVGITGRAHRRRRIGMAGDAKLVGHLADELGDLHQQFLGAREQVGAARREHVDLVLAHHLNANAFGRVVDQ